MADKFQLKALITGVDRLSPMLKGVQRNAMSMRKRLEKTGLGKISFGELATGGAFAAPFVAGVKAAIKFESSMADVKKVVDFETPAEFGQMRKDIMQMSTEMPMAADGIAKIVAAGGQAGIPRKELKGFAKDAVMMGVAFDQTADESGQMMATWRTAFRIGQTEVVKLADQINYLGNTGPASAKKISSIVTKIGPLGEVAGLASGQIAAMGATMAGMGVDEDVAATGLKNFTLAMTKGAAASKKQQDVFKALRLDSRQIAEGMQKDAQGTILRVLTAISRVDKSKQSAVLERLFGRESIGAIAPMLTNLEKLKENFGKVGDASQYAGSMGKEYAARADTTENSLQQLKNRVEVLGITVGSVLLPPLNKFLNLVGPLIGKVTEFAEKNPKLIEGLVGAAGAFMGMRLAVAGVTVALKLMDTSPTMIAITALALLAGYLIANWDTVGPWFANLWENIKGYATAGWELFKKVASFTPLGLIMKNWEPIVSFFQGLWQRIGPIVETLFGAKTSSIPIVKSGGAGVGAQPLQARQSPVAATQQLQRQQVNGEIKVRFENTPPGTKVQQTTQTNTGVKVTNNVGRRSLASA